METIDKAIDTAMQLIALEEKKLELLKQLATSLRIRKIMPEAFKSGTTARVEVRSLRGKRTFHIVLSSGEEQDITESEYTIIKGYKGVVAKRSAS